MTLTLSIRAALVASAAALALAACASTPAESDASAAPSPAGTPVAPSSAPEATADADAAAEPAADVPEQLQFSTTTVVDGEAFDAATLAGKNTILWFWAPWCPTCQAESGSVAQANAELPEGVMMMGVAGRADVADMQGFVDDFGVEGFIHLADEDGSIWSNFGVAYQPAFALIDDDGTITTIPGSLSKDGILDAAAKLADS
jgi:thiol-disulfide isomerase/thioredoxin